MLTENVNFGRYGKTFQEGFVQLIFEDRPFADQITEVLDIRSFWSLSILRVFVSKVIDYRNVTARILLLEAMITILRTDMDGDDEVITKPSARILCTHSYSRDCQI